MVAEDRDCLRLEEGAETSTRGSGRGSSVMAAVSAKSAAAQARAVKGSWVELKSTSPFVSLSMQYTEPEGGGSRYASNSHALNPSLRLPPPLSTR